MANLYLGQIVANTGGGFGDEKEQQKSKAAYVLIAWGLLIRLTHTLGYIHHLDSRIALASEAVWKL